MYINTPSPLPKMRKDIIRSSHKPIEGKTCGSSQDHSGTDDSKNLRSTRWKRIWLRIQYGNGPGRGYMTILIVLALGFTLVWKLPWKVSVQPSVQDQSAANQCLITNGGKFLLKGKPFRILSGSIHYFRVPRAYWRDRLAKLRAVGLNTVDTYVAWNLHEELQGQFDFSGNLDLVDYLKIAHELGLYVILRPGPYICSEWDWGGLPVWLMVADPEMEVRSMHHGYLSAVERFLTEVFRRLEPLQCSNGGPIIAVQIENEYGAYSKDKNYLLWAHQLLTKQFGVSELLFTSDIPEDQKNGHLPGLLAVVNFNDMAERALNSLEKLQPGMPLMVGEFWPGWFDHWAEKHHVMSAQDMVQRLEPALKRGASINLYPFHGGTNFGFMNGANFADVPQLSGTEGAQNGLLNRLMALWLSKSRPRHSTYYRPTITSYDFDAPLNEFGGKTEKYEKLKELLTQYQNIEESQSSIDTKNLNEDPWTTWRPPIAYGTFNVSEYALLTDVLDIIKPLSIPDLQSPKFVEKITGPDAHLLWYGFVAYRTTIQGGITSKLIIDGIVADRMQIIINGKTEAAVESEFDHVPVNLIIDLSSEPEDIILLVENRGRVNYARMPAKLDKQYKGFEGEVRLENSAGKQLKLGNWKVYSVRFRDPENLNRMVTSAMSRSIWKPLGEAFIRQPAFYRVGFHVRDIGTEFADDTFLLTKNWTKGVVYANGMNLGRYSQKGPQQTMYLPGPWLKKGEKNELIIFELEKSSGYITLQAEPVPGQPCSLPCDS